MIIMKYMAKIKKHKNRKLSLFVSFDMWTKICCVVPQEYYLFHRPITHVILQDQTVILNDSYIF